MKSAERTASLRVSTGQKLNICMTFFASSTIYRVATGLRNLNSTCINKIEIITKNIAYSAAYLTVIPITGYILVTLEILQRLCAIFLNIVYFLNDF